MPALYQLLPRARHGSVRVDGTPVEDVLDADLWERHGWGFFAPDQEEVLATLLPALDGDERRAVARGHLERSLSKARRIQQALDAPADPPPHLELVLFVGDAVDTPNVAEVDSASGNVTVAEHAPGDGTVTRSSALLDERVGREWTSRLTSPIGWSRVMFFFRDHIGLTQDPAFLDNLLYILLEEPG